MVDIAEPVGHEHCTAIHSICGAQYRDSRFIKFLILKCTASAFLRTKLNISSHLGAFSRRQVCLL